MTKMYQGYDADKKVWEQFGWDEKEEPTPESTGYEKVEEITSESLMDNE